MSFLGFEKLFFGLLFSFQSTGFWIVQSESVKSPVADKTNRSHNSNKIQVIRSFSKEIAKNRILVTIDMESENGTVKLLDALKKNNMKMTFFICGAWGHNHKSLIKRMHEEGHEIANHTSGHKQMTKLSETAMRQQITKLDQLVTSAIGQKPAPLFRPPYGAYNDKVLQVLASLGYQAVILWNVDPYDWKSNSSKNSVARSLDKMQPGSIIVLHSYRHTIDAVIDQLPKIKAKGFTVASIGSILAEEREFKSSQKTVSGTARPK